jgi:hypothetical protein
LLRAFFVWAAPVSNRFSFCPRARLAVGFDHARV